MEEAKKDVVKRLNERRMKKKNKYFDDLWPLLIKVKQKYVFEEKKKRRQEEEKKKV